MQKNWINCFYISSPEPKAQVSFSDQNLSVVRRGCCRSRCCCSCKLFTFSSSSPELMIEPISTKHGTKHPWVKGIQICSIDGPCPFPWGDNYEIVKIHWWNLKILFSRTTWPISTKFGTKHPWVMRTQVCSNEGPCIFPRGDSYQIVKIHWRNLKILLLQNHLTNFNQIWHNTSLCKGDSSLFKWRIIQFLKSR